MGARPAEAWPQSCRYWKNSSLSPSHGIGWTRSCGGGLPPHLQGAIDFQNRRRTPGPSASPRERHHGRPLLRRATAQAPRAPRTAKPRVGSRTLTPTPKHTNSESSPVPLASGPLACLCSLQPSGRRGGRGKSGAGRPNRRESWPERPCPRVSQLPVTGVRAGGSGLPKAVGGRAGTVTFHPQGTLPSRRRFPRPGAARVVGAGQGAAGRGFGGTVYPEATG